MTSTATNDNCFQFLKVDEFFAAGLDGWQRVIRVSDPAYDSSTRTLSLAVTTSEAAEATSTMLVQAPRHDIVRVRYNCDNATPRDYPTGSPRSQAHAVAVAAARSQAAGDAAGPGPDPERVSITTHSDRVELTTYHDSAAYLRVCIFRRPFGIRVLRVTATGAGYPVLADAEPALLFRRNTCQGHSYGASVMAVKTKPASALYTGFGEHGGRRLFKERVQHNFFNYDNLGYGKVYGMGAGDEREPLYHSSTFFLELNGSPGQSIACGIFVDNTSQTLVDIGVTDAEQVRFVSAFGELDYYMFVGDTPADVVIGYSLLIDHARLKPRWALGYHQGCYGYESRSDVEAVARKYRDYQIPIDGLHIDVDLQHNYQGFTIDPGKFPDAKAMFASLREAGYKCSTNITPILSDQDPGYRVYAEARDKGFLIADHRTSPAGPAAEIYQDYSGGDRVPDLNERNLNPSSYGTGRPYIGEVYYGDDRGTSGSYPDLGREEVRRWWGQQYQPLFDAGLQMVWQDMTTPAIRNSRGDMCGFPFKLLVSDDSEGIHEGSGDTTPGTSPAIAAWNLYSYNLHKATYQGLNALKGRENLRNFIIGRGGYSGMSRYAALWTGDNTSSWEFLQTCVPQILAIGLSAQPVSGADVGGFNTGGTGEKWADPALLIRWTAAGAFLPWFRNHYSRKDGKLFQEAWAYQELDLAQHGLEEESWLYKSVLPICKYYIELRYRMLQLFYDAMFTNMLTGMPICRPLFLVHADDTSLLYDKLGVQNTQFMVGDDLLVAPVLDREDHCHGQREVYLPVGAAWYCFTDNRLPLAHAQPGGSVVTFDAHISADPEHLPFIVPLYVRAGAVIPMTELEQYVGQLHRAGEPLPITYTIYPGAEGSHTSYLDDGVSRSSAPIPDDAFDDDPMGNGEYRQVTVKHQHAGDKRIIDITRDQDGYTPPEPFFYVALPHDPDECPEGREPVNNIRLNGTTVKKIINGAAAQRDAALRTSGSDAWFYNDAIKTSFVKVFDTGPALQLIAVYASG